MAGIKSKQLQDFNNNVTWTSATSREIPNSKDIMNEFVPEDSLIIETFTNQTISSNGQTWQLNLSYQVQGNDTNMVTLFINGLKIQDAASSISVQTITFNAIDYDIDSLDVLEVHYIKAHTV